MDLDLPTIQIGRRQPLRERTVNSRSRSNSREIIFQGSGRPRCIDLTTGMDEDFIDLTSPQATRGVNDSPVVVLDDNETEGSGRQSRGRRGRQRQSRTSGTTSSTPANANDSVVILPDLDLSQDTDTASTSDPTSPGLRKIVCPICLDDEKQIQRSGRQLASTICGHVFCQQCIMSAVSSLHCCPTCRKKLNKGKVFPLYI